MKNFNPINYVRGMQQLLISDKKRIGFLFGAGTSLSKKNDNSAYVPAIGKMTECVLEKLMEKEEFENALKEIMLEIPDLTIESLLSNLETKKNIIGNGTINGLDKSLFEEMLFETKKKIIEIVSIHNGVNENNKVNDLIQTDFAEWVGRASRKYPIEIFTTNYDYLFEIGLESKNINYYDGFCGSFEPFFNSETVNDLRYLPNEVKLWKIHGSLGWQFKKNDGKVIRSSSGKDDILIYPSILKYDHSRKQPYIALMDRLSGFLKQDDSVLFVCGYSFGDEHINERIITAIRSNPSAHIYVLFYDKYWENDTLCQSLTENSQIAQLAKENAQISILGSRNAVIGSQFGKWTIPDEPENEETNILNQFFDEDAYTSLEEVLNKEEIGQEIWTGEGELTIVDFCKFTDFLKTMMGMIE